MNKNALLAAILFLTASSLYAAERIEARRWRRAKVYDMRTLQASEPPLHSIVGVRFNYRHERIRHLKPNWYQGSIWRYRREEQDEFDYVQVMVSKADLPFFQALPTELQSAHSHVVYGEVLRDTNAGFTFLRLIGTKAKRDARGRRIVTW